MCIHSTVVLIGIGYQLIHKAQVSASALGAEGVGSVRLCCVELQTINAPTHSRSNKCQLEKCHCSVDADLSDPLHTHTPTQALKQ